MMKTGPRRKALAFLLTALLFLFAGGDGQAQAPDRDGILWLMDLYRYTLPQDKVDAVFTRLDLPLEGGAVKVVLKDVLYDGVVLCTAAAVTPAREDVLIFPASAGWMDPVAGGYGENLRSDTRSFAQAALEDEKLLASVQVYPLAFEDAPVFFVDHRQDAGEQSTLFSGASVFWLEHTKTTQLLVDVTLYDPVTGSLVSHEQYVHPLELAFEGEIRQAAYRPQQAGSPLESIILTQTPLTTYVETDWKTARDEEELMARLYDGEGQAYEEDRSPGEAVKMRDLPSSLSVQLFLCIDQSPVGDRQLFVRE